MTDIERHVDVRAQRLSMVAMDGRKRAPLIRAARLAAFDLAAFGAISHDGPMHDVSIRVVGHKTGVSAGLEAFEVTWLGDSSPSARMRFAGWPWRQASITELVTELKRLVQPA